MLICRTPYRFSFYGGGLDYPEWYLRKQARVLCAGLDYYCYLTVRILPPFFNHRYRIAYSKVETVREVGEIEHPAVREIVKMYGNNESLEINHIGDLPSKSGIGSSSSFSVGLINALSVLSGKFLGRTELVIRSITIERDAMGEKVGFQDQCAAAFGGLVLVEADQQCVMPRKFIVRSEYIDYITSNLLMGFDGIERYSSVASTIVSNNIASGKADRILNALTEISNEGINAFGMEADINLHAKLTRESRDLKIHLNGDSSSKRTSEIIEATEKAGSLCTRIMGAGGGGFFVCWAPKHRHEEIKNSVRINTWVNVRFSHTGSQVIFAG